MKTSARFWATASAAVVLSGSLAACSGDSSPDRTTLNVYAAASLTKTFTELADRYETAHPGVDVKLNFAGSSALVNQIRQGADADVVATADEKTMGLLGDAVVDPKVFATNTLVIVTAEGNPEDIQRFADLRKPGVRTVVCAVEVPCGAATSSVEKKTNVDLAPVSEEPSVSAVLAKITSGEADAGLVYVTDAKSAGPKISVVGDPAFAAVVNRYPIAALAKSSHRDDAAMFVGMVTGQTGGEILGNAGFTPPTP